MSGETTKEIPTIEARLDQAETILKNLSPRVEQLEQLVRNFKGVNQETLSAAIRSVQENVKDAVSLASRAVQHDDGSVSFVKPPKAVK